MMCALAVPGHQPWRAVAGFSRETGGLRRREGHVNDPSEVRILYFRAGRIEGRTCKHVERTRFARHGELALLNFLKANLPAFSVAQLLLRKFTAARHERFETLVVASDVESGFGRITCQADHFIFALAKPGSLSMRVISIDGSAVAKFGGSGEYGTCDLHLRRRHVGSRCD